MENNNNTIKYLDKNINIIREDNIQLTYLINGKLGQFQMDVENTAQLFENDIDSGILNALHHNINEIEFLKNNLFQLLGLKMQIYYFVFFYKNCIKYDIEVDINNDYFIDTINKLFLFISSVGGGIKEENVNIDKKKTADTLRSLEAEWNNNIREHIQISSLINKIQKFDSEELESIILVRRPNTKKSHKNIIIPSKYLSGIINTEVIKAKFPIGYNYDDLYDEFQKNNLLSVIKKIASILLKFLNKYTPTKKQNNTKVAAFIYDFLIFCDLLPKNDYDIQNSEKRTYLKPYIKNPLTIDFEL